MQVTQTVEIDEDAMCPLLQIVASYCTEHSLNISEVLATFATLVMKANDVKFILIENGSETPDAYEVKLHIYRKGDRDVVHA